MPDWFTGHEIDAVIMMIAFVALAISIRTERRVSRLDAMSFPGVTADWVTLHKAGARSELPPLRHNTDEILLRLTDTSQRFEIAEVKLTRWEEYWQRYQIEWTHQQNGIARAYVSPNSQSRRPLPQYLRIKVERIGGVQASCWQVARISTNNQALGQQALQQDATLIAIATTSDTRK